MILQELHSLYKRLENDTAYELAPTGYSLQKISFCVVLHPDGRLHAIEDRRIDGHSQQIRVLGTTKPPGSGLNPCFLWDNTGYMLGYKPNDPKPARTKETFEAFKKRHLAVETEIGSSSFSAVCRFLETWDPDKSTEHPVLNEIATGFGLFQIIGQTAYVHQDICIDAWWRKQFANVSSSDAPIGQCLLTGKIAPIARLIPMIKGVAGGKAQMALIGFNDSAYESYGKEQAFNSPISEEAAFQWTSSLNALLDGPMRQKHRFMLGDATTVFWTDKPTLVEDIFAQFACYGDIVPKMEENQDAAILKKVSVFCDGLRNGIENCPELANDVSSRFCLLMLSANAARIVVRRFLNGTIAELLKNLRRHYCDMGIERQYGEDSKHPDPEFPPIWLLERQTARDVDGIPSILNAPLTQAIIDGTRYPNGLYTAVIRRIFADRRVNYPRACIIKGHLTRNRNMEVSMSLDKSRKDLAYRTGRLFATLEKTQTDALGDVNASIRDRFYGAASATPQSIFPRLMRMYSHYLRNLPPGLKISREKLIQEIVDDLTDFPPHFNLAEQGLFAIGYYHQRNDFFRPQNSDKLTETPAN